VSRGSRRKPRAATRGGEVVGGQRHPAVWICRLGDQPTAELVEPIGEPLQVGLLGVGREVDVLGDVPSAVGLDRSAADDDELDVVPEEDLQQLAAAGVDRVP
jgi:hypothetical protein